MRDTGVYTSSGHRCGVIPYSSVVWWIASWAEDEQVQGKNNLLRRGVLELVELVWWPWWNGSSSRSDAFDPSKISRAPDPPFLLRWLALFIEALVLSPNV